MSVKERLILFLKVSGISQAMFEAAVGLSNGYVNNIRNSIQPNKIQKITLHYPELNMGWLLTGEGEMLKNGKAGKTIIEDNRIDNVELIELKKELIKLVDNNTTLSESISKLIEQNSMLTSKLLQLMNKEDKH